MTQMANRFGSFRWQWSGNRYFHLELSTRYRAYVEPTRLVLLAVCAGLGCWVLWSFGVMWVDWRDLEEMQARVEQVRGQDLQLVAAAQAEGIDLSDAALRQLPAEVSLANQLLVKRNFSWTQFLSGLEEIIPHRVSIKSVRLDPESATVHMTGIAVTLEDVTALTLKLQTHPVFHDPVLGQHHSGGNGLVEFDLKLKYRPQGA